MGPHATKGEKAYILDFDKNNMISEGNYAKVYKVTKRIDYKICAAKHFKIMQQ